VSSGEPGAETDTSNSLKRLFSSNPLLLYLTAAAAKCDPNQRHRYTIELAFVKSGIRFFWHKVLTIVEGIE